MDPFSPVTLGRVAVCLLLLLLPGTALYALVMRAGGDRRAGFPAAPLFGVGLSIAFWPLLLLYTTLSGFSLQPVFALVILAASALSLAALWVPVVRRFRPTARELSAGISLAGMSLLALVFRLRDIQGLPVPMFGDSLHHTMIATIIANTGQVPSGYQPFVPVDTFTYHFGFHTLAAVLARLTGASPADAVLLVGQVLIVMAVPAAYLMARTLFRSSSAGLFAALLTGFVSAMPAYYVNWGRYTQIAGQVLLPAGLALLWLAAQSASETPRRLKIARFALAAFCVAGLVVVHYRILIFYGLFGIALALGQLALGWRNPKALLRLWLFELGIVLAGLLASATWLGNLIANYVPGLFGRLRTVSTEYLAGYNSLENFRRYVGLAIVAAAFLGVLFALYRLWRGSRPPNSEVEQQKPVLLLPVGALLVAGWAVLMAASIVWPPGAIGSYTVAISLYIPLTVLGGYGISRLLSSTGVPVLRRGWFAPALALVAAPLAALAMGTWHLSDPGQFSYVQPADLAAFNWVKVNTPENSKFLISSEFSYAGRGLTASDAGMWLPLLAGRNVSVPALSSWTEHPLAADFFTNTRTLAAYTQPRNDPAAQALAATGVIPPPRDPADPQTLALMQKLGINYVYYGAQEGHSTPGLDLVAMRRESCRFKLVYAEGGVYIFQVQFAATCP